MPPFFIPIIAFILWASAILLSFPVLKLNLNLADQTTAAFFFISNLILVVAWPLSGPVAAAILSVLSSVLAIYLCLGTREPAYLLQLAIYGALFFYMALYLVRVQRETSDKRLLKERLTEDQNLSQKAIAEKKELKAALQRKVDYFLNLEKFSEELKEAHAVESVAAKIVREVQKVLPQAEECALSLVGEGRRELIIVANTRGAKAPSKGDEDGSVFDQWVVKRSQATLVEDSGNDFRFASDTVTDVDRFRSVCASPLLTENKVLGVIRASASRPASFTADDLRLVDILGSFGAVALRNRLLYETMEYLAMHDSLTGLVLNRAFQDLFSEVIEQAASQEMSFSVLMLDIDFFKKYNDEYGHSAGDMVLKHIASIFQENLGPRPVAARYGGEEFIALLPWIEKKEALTVAEKIRAGVERRAFVLRRVQRRITVSLGVAAFPGDGRTRESLIRAVDRNLYKAKKSGRNRVCGDT